jgi:hypothetical protein
MYGTSILNCVDGIITNILIHNMTLQYTCNISSAKHTDDAIISVFHVTVVSVDGNWFCGILILSRHKHCSNTSKIEFMLIILNIFVSGCFIY